MIGRLPPRTRPALDNACVELDREKLGYGCSGFSRGLQEDLLTRPLSYLRLHYPELVFGEIPVCPAKRKPKDHEFLVRFGRGYRFADWRRAPQAPSDPTDSQWPIDPA